MNLFLLLFPCKTANFFQRELAIYKKTLGELGFGGELASGLRKTPGELALITPVKDLRHCHAMLGGNGAVPPQMKYPNIFCVRPPITLQMFVVMLQDYTGPTKKD